MTTRSPEPSPGSNKADCTVDRHCKESDKADDATVQVQVQGRRPALGRKRAHFSFNSKLNYPHLNVDLKSSVDHIQDPDELFTAFENIECAMKELKKQTGGVATYSSLNDHWVETRKRRPGILGRRASYKHHFLEPTVAAEAFALSQEENHTFSSSNIGNGADAHSSQQQVSQLDKQPEDMVADNEKGVDKLLDTLLHSFEDLDKGGEIDFLQERLQIKSTNLDKICLPRLDGNKTQGETVKDSKSSKEKLGGSLTSNASPTAASTPLAAISVFRRRISQLDPLKDPFSVLVSSSSEKPSPEVSSSDKGSKKRTILSHFYAEQPDMASCEKLIASGSECIAEVRSKPGYKMKLQPSITGDGTSFVHTALVLDDSCCQNDQAINHSSGNVNAAGTANSVGSTSFIINHKHNIEVHDILPEVLSEEVDLGDKELPSTHGGNGVSVSADLFIGGDASACTDQLKSNNSVENKVDDNKEAHALDGSVEPSTSAAVDTWVSQSLANSTISTYHDKVNQKGLTALPDLLPELKSPQNRQSRRGKDARKHSLAGSGMAWQCGVRRSTRIKMKPLEFWRGERPLYARIHESLPTLVGLKYASPTKSGRKQKQLKVKSYVSDEYAGLVQKIALH